jgi:hypothetical protein
MVHIPDIDDNNPHERAHVRYFATLGYAFHTWSWLEFHIADWFAAVMQFKPDTFHQYRAVFHAPRSFSGSLELLDTAISSSSFSEEYKTLFRRLRKKTHTYSGTRNRLAHGISTYRVRDMEWEMGTHEHVLSPLDQRPRGYSIEDLQTIIVNFDRLAKIWAQTVPRINQPGTSDQLPPREALRLLQELPSEAFSKQASPAKAGRPPES